MRNFSDNFEKQKRENNRDQDNMIDRHRFRAICSIRFELENSDFDFVFNVEMFWRQRVDGALEIILMKIIFLKGEEEGILKIFRRHPF